MDSCYTPGGATDKVATRMDLFGTDREIEPRALRLLIL